MEKTLYLHIGSGKTGTSTIQGTLHRNAAALGRAGVVPIRSALGVLAATCRDPMSLTPVRMRKLDSDTVSRQVQAARRELEDWSEGPNPVGVVSNEHFLSFDTEEIARLAEFLRAFAPEVRVVFYARHPASKMSALLEQQVKSGLTRLGHAPARLVERFNRRLPMWASVFGRQNMIVRKFARGALYRDNPFFDFCDAIDRRDICDFIEPVYRNEGISHAGVLIADALNSFAPAYSEGRGPSDYLAEIPGPKFRLPIEAVTSVQTEIDRQLDYLESDWGITFGAADGAPNGSAEDPFGPDVLEGLARILNAQALEIQSLRRTVRRLERTAPKAGGGTSGP